MKQEAIQALDIMKKLCDNVSMPKVSDNPQQLTHNKMDELFNIVMNQLMVQPKKDDE